jgi:hypothetical protein
MHFLLGSRNINTIDNLRMFCFMGFIPEKVTPWYADSVQYSLNDKCVKYSPGNFRPDKDWETLMLVARKAGIEEVPTNLDFAYQVVNLEIKKRLPVVDYEKEIFSKIKYQKYRP